MRGLALVANGDNKKALVELYQSERHLDSEDFLARETSARERKVIAGFRARAQEIAQKEDSDLALELAGEFPAVTVLEDEAEESALIIRLQIALDEGDYETAHRLAEKYVLARHFVSRSAPLSPEKRSIIDRLSAMKNAISDLEDELVLGRELSGFGALLSPSLPTLFESGSSIMGKEYNEIQRRLRSKKRALKDFVVELKTSNPEISALVGGEPSNVAQLQRLISKDQVILQYVLLSDRSLIFAVTPSDIEFFEVPVGRESVREHVLALRRSIESQSSTIGRGAFLANKEPSGPSLDLVAILLQPVMRYLESASELIIVPNDSLHLLPFTALVVDGYYVGEKWSISYLSASSLLPISAGYAFAEKRLLGIGNPSHPDWPALVGAGREIESIRSFFSASEVYLGSEAKKEVLVGKELKRIFLHLATHAQAGHLEETRLVFADDYLSLEEVWGLDLEGSPLVVLSACNTSIGDMLGGDEVASLTNGFLYAGAKRVISSLWRVSDDATRILMTEFYRNLSGGSGAAEALRRAQDVVKNREGFSSPFYWAGFVLHGW